MRLLTHRYLGVAEFNDSLNLEKTAEAARAASAGVLLLPLDPLSIVLPRGSFSCVNPGRRELRGRTSTDVREERVSKIQPEVDKGIR